MYHHHNNLLKESNTPDFRVLVGSQPLSQYVLECLCLFNSDCRELYLFAVGQNISKAFECALQLKNYAHVDIGKTDLRVMNQYVPDSVAMHGETTVNFTCVEIIITKNDSFPCISNGEKWQPKRGEDHMGSNWASLSFPACELLMRYMLNENSKLTVETEAKDENGLNVEITIAHNASTDLCIDCSLVKGKLPEEFCNSMSRSAIILSPDWHTVAGRLGEFDDIILGIDTNIIYNCILSRQLIDGFALTSPDHHLHTPNWIMVVIPQSVMQELEYAANHRDFGRLNAVGRRGFRALAEIFQLHHADISGISVIVCGSADPNLDMGQELWNIRLDMNKIHGDLLSNSEKLPNGSSMNLTRPPKSSSHDSIIRDQFREFLQRISFYKGSYFLTCDRASHALARSEALHSLYYSKNKETDIRNQINGEDKMLSPSSINCNIDGKDQTVLLRVPLARVIHELSVDFGRIKINSGDIKLEISLDERGELQYWINQIFFAKHEALKRLAQSYQGFPIEIAEKMWNKLTSPLEESASLRM